MDNVVLNKTASLERCIQRIREEYIGHELEIDENYTKQDSIVLNLQRACEICLDIAVHIIRKNHLGLPQSSRESFEILQKEKIISKELSASLQNMVGFRNIAVHDYTSLDIDVVRSILEQGCLMLKNKIIFFKQFSNI